MSASKIPQLREALAQLEAYQLPERYTPLQQDHDENHDSIQGQQQKQQQVQPLIDPKVHQRYLKAKEKYFRTRMSHLFLEHISTLQYNDNDHDRSNDDNDDKENAISINLPMKPSKERMQELNEYKFQVKKELLRNVKQVKLSYDGVCEKYTGLKDKTDELKRAIHAMEDQEEHEKKGLTSKDNDVSMTSSNNGENDMDMDNYDGNDEQILDSELKLEEEKLKTLREKRNALQIKLRKIQLEKQNVSRSITNNKKLVVKMMSERKDESGTTNHNDKDGNQNQEELEQLETLDMANLPSVQETEAETEELRQKSHNYQDMAEYYDSIKCAMETISGMRILSITSANTMKDQSTDEDEKNMPSPTSSKKTSPHKKRQHRRSLSNSSSSSSLLLSLSKQENENNGSINLKVLFLDTHIVNITLSHNASPLLASSPSAAAKQPMEMFRVTAAQFETTTTIYDHLHDDEIHNANPEVSTTSTVSMNILPLDDLVALSSNLGSLHDLRFVLRETMARIRSTTSRVDELAKLRIKYLTKITNPEKNKIKYGYGGEDQEVICSLKCQISVWMRLTADCPLLDGSVYIHKLIGLGGWNQECLEKMKKKINLKKWRRPIQLMDALVEEIERVVNEDGVNIPRTPTLPMKKS